MARVKKPGKNGVITFSEDGNLLGLLLEVGDEVVPVLGLLETGEGHLGTRDVLLGVLAGGKETNKQTNANARDKGQRFVVAIAAERGVRALSLSL